MLYNIERDVHINKAFDKFCNKWMELAETLLYMSRLHVNLRHTNGNCCKNIQTLTWLLSFILVLSQVKLTSLHRNEINAKTAVQICRTLKT